MIKKDNYFTGLWVAVLTPLVAYLIFYGLDLLVIKVIGRSMVRAPHYLYLLAVTPNLFWVRFYLGKLHFAKSGMSSLLVTIVFILLYFFKYFNLQ